MMESLAFVMAILGCGEGDLPCAELRQAPSRYESRTACLAATEEEIARHTDLDFPVIVAQCRRAGGPARSLRANDVLLPEPDRNPAFPTTESRSSR